ncbi:hypothetical protein [Thiomicrorhabdus cannonii]|uniref:hypothetical protein n=1 Tax=Thiomicrorhabdus cannonii TaxID=2748011 RepID=UPI0015B7F70F|nr:hypothetical protein [Thiomicrorhabdus cannonii]
MRVEIEQETLEGICVRFLDLARNHLGLSLSQLSAKLEYTNPSTLTKVNKHKGFIGPDKLKKFGELKNGKGQRPNIDYIITGKEPMFINDLDGSENTDLLHCEAEKVSKELIEKLGVEKVKKLLEVIVV